MPPRNTTPEAKIESLRRRSRPQLGPQPFDRLRLGLHDQLVVVSAADHAARDHGQDLDRLRDVWPMFAQAPEYGAQARALAHPVAQDRLGGLPDIELGIELPAEPSMFSRFSAAV
jgi:hypothetical protein